MMTGKKRKQMKKTIRYDTYGNELRKGERQQDNGTYRFKWVNEYKEEKYVYAKTLEEIRVKEEEIEQNKFMGINTDGINMTLNKMFELWFETKRGVKPTTKDDYEYLYDLYVRKTLGTRKLKSLTPIDLQRFYIEMVDKKGLNCSTVEAAHRVIHQVLESAVANRYILYNPSNKILRELKAELKNKEVKKTALSDEQVNIILQEMGSHKNHHRFVPIFTFMAETGMRVGEVTGLCWSSVDLERGVVFVNQTLRQTRAKKNQKGTRSLQSPKTKTSTREIPLTARAKESLLKEKEFQEHKGIKCKKPFNSQMDFVFLGYRGTPLSPQTLNVALKDVIAAYNKTVTDESMKLPHTTNHTFRHTFATLANESGMNPKVTQTILGHSSYSMTMDVYTDVSSRFAKEEMERMENWREHTPKFAPDEVKNQSKLGNIVQFPTRKNCAKSLTTCDETNFINYP